MVVSEIMTRDVQIASPEDSLQTAAQMMAVFDFGMVPVLNREQRLVGILSLGDLAVSEPEPAADALASISQPETFETRP